MNTELTFILERAEASRNAQELVAELWVWPELTVSQWDTMINAFRVQDQIVARKEAQLRTARGAVDFHFQFLHELTVQGLCMARQKYRHHPEKLAGLKGITIAANSRMAMMEEARTWEVAWEELDENW